MSSLIVLCPHCLTWIEPHGQCCTECGSHADIDDPDPPSQAMSQRLGDRLHDLGPMKLVRRGWPNCGDLLVTTEGLLFVPQLTMHPNGALEAVADQVPNGSGRVASLFHLWSLPPWRRPADKSAQEFASASRDERSPLELLFDFPGAFFIQRSAIQRISIRWGRAQIERRPSRSVTLTQVSGGQNVREALRSLTQFAAWRTIVAEL